MYYRKLIATLLTLTSLFLFGFETVPSAAQAQSTSEDCVRIACGPSGMFSREEFPTITSLDFKAFPARTTRPYTVRGRIWTVRPDGNDSADGSSDHPLASLARAVELARTGDGIQVGDGTYSVTADGVGLTLDKPGLTLFAEHIGGALLNGGSEGEIAITASADDLVIDGFIVKAAPRGYGIYFGRLDRPQRNLVLENLLIDGGEAGLNSAITPDGQVNPQPVIKGLRLQHVVLKNASLIGFNCGQGPCDDMRLENVVVTMRPDPAVETSGADAIAVENGDNILVFNVEVTGASADGLDFKATRMSVVNVVVHDVSRNGIKLWHDGDVVNALVYNTGADAALVFDGGGKYRVLHTIVARHAHENPGGAYAMTVANDHPGDPGQLTLANSIFYQNSGAIWVSGAIRLDARNNIFFGSGNGQELVWQRDPEIGVGEQDGELSTLETAGGGCCNIGFVDPRFAADGSYTLAKDSPGLNRGATDLESVPDFDLIGAPRIVGKAPDLGPRENQ